MVCPDKARKILSPAKNGCAGNDHILQLMGIIYKARCDCGCRVAFYIPRKHCARVSCSHYEDTLRSRKVWMACRQDKAQYGTKDGHKEKTGQYHYGEGCAGNVYKMKSGICNHKEQGTSEIPGCKAGIFLNTGAGPYYRIVFTDGKDSNNHGGKECRRSRKLRYIGFVHKKRKPQCKADIDCKYKAQPVYKHYPAVSKSKP